MLLYRLHCAQGRTWFNWFEKSYVAICMTVCTVLMKFHTSVVSDKIFAAFQFMTPGHQYFRRLSLDVVKAGYASISHRQSQPTHCHDPIGHSEASMIRVGARCKRQCAGSCGAKGKWQQTGVWSQSASLCCSPVISESSHQLTHSHDTLMQGTQRPA